MPLLTPSISQSLCTSFLSSLLPAAPWPWGGSISGEKILESYLGSDKRLDTLGSATPRIRHNTALVVTLVNMHSTQVQLMVVMSSINNLVTRS
jgi:hypothetical protein